MAPTRKIHRRTVPTKICAKSRGANRPPVKAGRPSATPAPSLGFLIVKIGGSTGGLGAMEALRVSGREGAGAAQVQGKRSPDPHLLVRGAR